VSNRRLVSLVAAFLCICSTNSAFAQLAPPAPVRQTVDGNGVDIFSGALYIDGPPISMGGSAPQGLQYYRLNRGLGWADNIVAVMNITGSTVTITMGGNSNNFTVSGSTYTNTEGNGSTLSLSGLIYTFSTADGTIAHFTKSTIGFYPFYANAGRITDLTRPSGQVLTYGYDSLVYCSGHKSTGGSEICTSHGTAYRVGSVRSNYGYSISLTYNPIDYDETDPEAVPDFVTWGTPVTANMSNLAQPGTTTSESFGEGGTSGAYYYAVTDAMGRTTKYSDGGYVTGITLPGSTSPDVVVTYSGSRVASITTPAGTTNYTSSDSGSVRTVTITDPLAHAVVYTFDIPSQRVTSKTDALGKVTSWLYDSSGRVTRTTQPEGNYHQITYDSRGNITEQRLVAKPGSGAPDIITSSTFPSTCTNTATCNKPTATFDELGNETDYTYDTTYGLVTSITPPAPTAGAIRPQIRYNYTSLQAYYSNGASIVASGAPVRLLTSTSTCQTSASCAGGADEVVTTISYGPQVAGVGNNLLPVSVTKGAGDGSLSTTVSYAYDAVGNQTSVDGPLSGSADTTTYRYDADREQVGVISPDPDGSGPMMRRATRTTYNADGIVVETETGTVNSTSDADWANFLSLQQKAITLDAADRPTVTTLSAGGTTYQLVQQSYDAAGRADCSAIRMNSAAWGSLPASACSLGTAGAFGADRISKTSYDADNHVLNVITAYGTASQTTDVTNTYNDTGTLSSATDAAGNKTSYLYDGFDRKTTIYFPSLTTGSGSSSSTDYETVVYDASSHVTSLRSRDGNTIAYGYDADGRLTSKTLPSGELSVTYTYDLLARKVSVANSQQVLTFTYDALGRILSQGGPYGNLLTSYDLAGQRTQVTWPDGFYVNYDHLATGEISAVRENGATSGIGVLAVLTYDNLGRRTLLVRGNGTSSSYAYDSVSRLTSFALDVLGTANDLNIGFSYSPSNQIASITRSNDIYAWSGSADRNDASSVNGLNEVTTVGAGSVTYDNKGNLSGTGSNTYTYSAENHLLTGPGGVSLVYDPLGRLSQENSSSTSANMLYDNSEMVGEYDSAGVLQKRYIYGASSLEPLLELDRSGSSFVDVWLHGDERGSVIAESDDTGAVVAVNTYDEYGVPSTANVGRFQYTGQTMLPTLGFYYYRGRMYSSRLGRFMQTDPLGYGDGANWYNYVSGDPINGTDPTGLQEKQLPYFTGSSIPGSEPAFEGCAGNCDGDGSDDSAGGANGGGSSAGGDGGGAGGGAGGGGVAPCSFCSLSSAVGQIADVVETASQDIVVTAAKYSDNGLDPTFGIAPVSQLFRSAYNFGYRHPYIVGAAATTLAIASCVIGCEGLFLEGAVIAAETTETYSAIGSTGQVGEIALKELGGESQVYFNTNLGGRFVDQLADGIANESKVGYQSLTSSNMLQILKDVELVNSGSVNSTAWHFFTSPVTLVGGPSAPLSAFLVQNGIRIVFH